MVLIKKKVCNARGRGTVGGRRESDDLGNGEMEVITLDSSDEETA